MGIKGLWTVLGPFSEKKSLHEIRGETLAIDLSGWVCDSQNVTDYYVQPKMYLRNLFFRTVYLLLSDVNPIFILEGDAPELKRDVMAARNAVQFRGAAPKTDGAGSKKPDTARRRFKGVQRECESLLKCMGVCCVKGSGEAEATCAELNEQGVQHPLSELMFLSSDGPQTLVDAVISQDSDCFAYGARRVYRNFSVSNAAGGGAMQGSVDCYDAGKMFDSTGFGRKKMVALALLCGCDYGVGACGSSITTAVGFLHTVPEQDVISRLISWVTDTEHYDKLARWCAAPGRCDRCGHVGRTHLKNGCPVCATNKGCQDLGHKAKIAEIKKELSLRNRALTCGMLFPEPKVMKEFLQRTPDNIDMASLKRPAPSLITFVKLMSQKLDWPERYCVEKFLPLLTKWHLQEKVPSRTIQPVHIKKKRTPKGVPSFEVVWEDMDGMYAELIPDDQYQDNEDHSVPWTSIERQDLMRQYYPRVVAAYEESIKKPAKEKKPRGRKKKETDGKETLEKPKRKYNRKPKNITNTVLQDSIKVLENNFNSSKLNVSVKVNKLKRKIKNSKKGTQKTIDSFVAKKRKRSSIVMINSLRNSFRNMSIHNDNISAIYDKENDVSVAEKENPNWLSLLEKSTEEVPENDLSDIIDNIISKKSGPKTVKFNNNLLRLVFDKSTPKRVTKKVLGEMQNCSTPKDSPVRRKSLFDAKYSFDNNCFVHNSMQKNLGYESSAKKSKHQQSTHNILPKKQNEFSNKDVRFLNNSTQKLPSKVNTSYFFDKLTDGDAFEMSLEHKSAVISLDCDTTVEYSLPEVIM